VEKQESGENTGVERPNKDDDIRRAPKTDEAEEVRTKNFY
jgi:hypothetical protein